MNPGKSSSGPILELLDEDKPPLKPRHTELKATLLYSGTFSVQVNSPNLRRAQLPFRFTNIME